jgi:ParB/RepB/Spo0J family partition protein
MSTQIQEIDIRDFDLSLSAMRITNMSRIRQVEKSMRIHGQLQPVVARVHDSGYQLIDGFKRVYACEALVMDRIQCRLLEVNQDQAKILMLSYNWSSQSMEAYEEALILHNLISNQAVTQRDLARHTGRSRSWVSRRLSLTERLDEAIGTEIRMGNLSSSHGRAIMKLPRGNQIAVASVITTCHLSSRDADKLVDAYLGAEDEKKQQQILENPERVLRSQHIIRLPEFYDPKLSVYDNNVLRGIHGVVESMQHLLGLLEAPGIKTIDTSLPGYGLELIHDGALCLQERLSELQTTKNKTEDER